MTMKKSRAFSLSSVVIGTASLIAAYQLGSLRSQLHDRQLRDPRDHLTLLDSSIVHTRIQLAMDLMSKGNRKENHNLPQDNNQDQATSSAVIAKNQIIAAADLAIKTAVLETPTNLNSHIPLTFDTLIDFPGPNWHPLVRSDRFPSVDERIRLYMSNWYQPPCTQDAKVFYKLSHDNDSFPTLRYNGPIDDTVQGTYESIVKPDAKILLEIDTISDCGRLKEEGTDWDSLELRPRTYDRIIGRANLWNYCANSEEILNITKELNDKDKHDYTPVILQMGDEKSVSLTIPVVAKYRGRIDRNELNRVTDMTTCSDRPHANTALGKGPMLDGYAPIVWNLNVMRHFGTLGEARTADIPWKDKKLGTLWRGFMTGSMIDGPETTELEQCLSNARCRFVYETNLQRNSSLIDAALIGMYPTYKGGITCNGITLVAANRSSLQELQQYKVVVALEGNDVSSALKWNLMSNSVILMPPPTRTSWAMEELLEPWVHYIPIHTNLSNLEEMIRWVGDNDNFARRISERATLFLYDLWISPEAKKEDMQVKRGILDRYRKLWL